MPGDPQSQSAYSQAPAKQDEKVIHIKPRLDFETIRQTACMVIKTHESILCLPTHNVFLLQSKNTSGSFPFLSENELFLFYTQDEVPGFVFCGVSFLHRLDEINI